MSDAYEKNMYVQARANILRTWVIITIFTAVVVGIAYGFFLYYNDISIVLIAVVIAAVSNVSSYFFSEKIALSSSGARRADKSNSEHLRLIRMVENMAITAGMPMPGIYVIEDDAPNAFATGRNPKHSSVAFTTGLLRILEDNELEGVVAHELSHIKNRDILVGTIVVIMIGFIALLADIFVHMGARGGSRSSGNNNSGLIIVGVIVLAVLSPIIGKLIQTAVSRKREFLADASGVLLTRYPEGLAHALVKINRYHAPLNRSSQATSHLFIANPFSREKGAGAFLSKLFSTHPPMEKRVEALLGKKYLDNINT